MGVSRCFSALKVLTIGWIGAVAAAQPDEENTPAFQLSERNTEAPFCYQAGQQRSWPIGIGLPATDDQIRMHIAGESPQSARPVVRADDLHISLDRRGWLVVESSSKDSKTSLTLQISLDRPDADAVTQELEIRPAPPVRPITYLADFGDDIIRIFGSGGNRYRPIQQEGFDQYFRRMQAHGVTRLIVWLSPFPYITDSADFAPSDWERYEGQARAVLSSPELAAGIRGRTGFSAWGWLCQLMALRLMPDLGTTISDSATAHGIQLTASFRPFEAALTKYYVVPVFDDAGRFLWNFHPLCSPDVNYHADQTGFAHYRELLLMMGQTEAATVSTITFHGVENSDNVAAHINRGDSPIRIRAAGFPPLAAESFVLVRQGDASFELRRWHSIRKKALEHLPEIVLGSCAADGSDLHVHTNDKHANSDYLWISERSRESEGLTLKADAPLTLSTASGVRSGGANVWFAWDEQPDSRESTRVSGIPPDGHYHAEFQATEASTTRIQRGLELVPLTGCTLVVSRGPGWSVEMLDFNQPDARAVALNQLNRLMRLPAFDGIVINTRSHTQLAGSLGDDGKNIRTLAEFARRGVRGVRQIGIDKSYLPRTAIQHPLIRKLVRQPDDLERLATVQPGAWRSVTCQRPDPYLRRYVRNQLVARGIRHLLQDIEAAFPNERVQIVIPPKESTVDVIQSELNHMASVHDKPEWRDFYRRLWPSNNHMPSIGEGMAMMDLSGLRAEPIFFGTGSWRQEPETLSLYVRSLISDMQGNRGSSYRGPRSYFFEIQSSLRAADKAAARSNREMVMRQLLQDPEMINDIILYESADWLYFLPLSDSDLSGHAFLDGR